MLLYATTITTFKHFQVSPIEVENLIRQNPGVLDVVVAGIPDPECEKLIVACVVRQPGYDVTAQEIKDLVKSELNFVLSNGTSINVYWYFSETRYKIVS